MNKLDKLLNKGFDAGRASYERERVALSSEAFLSLRNAVFLAALDAYKEALKLGNVEGAAYLRFHGGITKIMKEAASKNDGLYVGAFGALRPYSELLSYNEIRNAALKAAKEGK